MTDARTVIAPGQGGRSKRRSTFLLLAATVVLLALLFPPFYCFFLAPFALVPFCVCILRRPMRLKYLGAYYLTGVGFFLPNLYWLAPVTIFGFMGLACFIALYIAAFAWGFHRLVVQLRMPATLAAPLVWTAIEYGRSTLVLGGFPWFVLGNCLTPWPLLIQTADLFGVWGLTFLIMLFNGFFVDLLRLPLWQKGQFNPVIKRLGIVASLGISMPLGYGLFRLRQQTTTPGPRVAVIQENIPQSQKEKTDVQDDLFMRHYRLAEQAGAASPRPDLIVWPETMTTAPINAEVIEGTPDPFTTDDELLHALKSATVRQDLMLRIDDIYKALKDQVNRTGIPALIGYGSIVPQREPLPYIRQNRSMLLLPYIGRAEEYSKIHLVPFGEFIPFRSLPGFRWLMLQLSAMPEDYTNTPGTVWTRFRLPITHAAATTAGLPSSLAPEAPASADYIFATPICFEDAMPEPSRMMTAAQYGNGRKTDFLLNISNDGWFMSVELDQHLQACQIRAVENRVPIARSVNTGNSGFIDSNGRIMGLVKDAGGRSIGAVGTLAMVLPLDSRMTLYGMIGDLLPMVCGVMSTLLVGWTFVRPRRGGARRGAA